MPFPDGQWMTQEAPRAFLTPTARKALEYLKSELEAKNTVYPDFQHVLIEADNRDEAFDADNYVAAHHFRFVPSQRRIEREGELSLGKKRPTAPWVSSRPFSAIPSPFSIVVDGRTAPSASGDSVSPNWVPATPSLKWARRCR